MSYRQTAVAAADTAGPSKLLFSGLSRKSVQLLTQDGSRGWFCGREAAARVREGVRKQLHGVAIRGLGERPHGRTPGRGAGGRRAPRLEGAGRGTVRRGGAELGARGRRRSQGCSALDPQEPPAPVLS